MIVYHDTVAMKEAIDASRAMKNTSLIRCLKSLRRYETNCKDRFKVQTNIYRDRSGPYCFYFERWMAKPGEEMAFSGNGGIIFHGKYDAGGAGGVAAHVTMEPTNGWQIHT